MARFGHVSKRGGVSALILATSAGLLMLQLAHSTTTASAAVATTTKVGVPATATLGSSVQLTATVAPAPLGAPKTGVTFLDNGVAIAPGMRSSRTGRYAITTSTLAAGAHSITAQFSGDSNNLPSTSAPATITIVAAGTNVATMNFTSGRHADHAQRPDDGQRGCGGEPDRLGHVQERGPGDVRRSQAHQRVGQPALAARPSGGNQRDQRRLQR
jgi:hypothetical protein